MIYIIYSFKLFGPNFELYSCLRKISIEFSLEISRIDHQLFILFCLLSQIPLRYLEFELFFLNSLLQKS